MPRILLYEDDDSLAEIIVETLERYAFATHRSTDYERIEATLSAERPVVVLLDINLPRYDGYELCRRIRAVSTVPVIFLSAREGSMDIVMAHSVGGDDYLTKPFDLQVLVAKIRSQIRRAYGFAENEREILEHKGFVLDLASGTFAANGESVELTRNELRLLAALMKRAGEIVSRSELEEALWRGETFTDENTLTVNVNRVRKLLARLGVSNPITTIRGIGYRFG